MHSCVGHHRKVVGSWPIDRRTITHLRLKVVPHIRIYTEYCGQAPSAPLYIREVPGSNPGGGLTRCGFFSHRGISHITQMRRVLGQSTSKYLPPSFRTHPHRTHPESSCQCGSKASGKPQQPARPLRGAFPNILENKFICIFCFPMQTRSLIESRRFQYLNVNPCGYNRAIFVSEKCPFFL
jgi:hypothetical protein